MKKLLSVMALIAILLTFSSCGSSKPQISRHYIDGSTERRVNTFTGLTLSKTVGWTFADEKYMAEKRFENMTEEQLAALTAEQMAEMDTIYDVYAVDERGKNAVLTYIANAAKQHPDSKTPGADFIAEFISRSEDIPARHTGAAVIGGREYQTITYYKSDKRQHYALRDLNNGYVSVIVCYTEDNATGRYFWDMFGEGHTGTTEVENVPDFRSYNDKNYIYTNESTGIKASIPLGWHGKNIDGIGEKAYGYKNGEYSKMTKEQLAEFNDIYDIILENDENGDFVYVYYKNRNNDPDVYKASAREYIVYQEDIIIDNGVNTVRYESVDIAGNSFSGFSGNYDDKGLYIFARELNVDYLVCVQAYSETGLDYTRYLSVFNENKKMPVENAVKISSYNRETKTFTNEKSGITLKVPDGWSVKTIEETEALCWNDASKVDMTTFTDRDYAGITYIPDSFIASDSEVKDMYIQYINRHRLVKGLEEKPDLSAFYDSEMERHSRIGTVQQERTFEVNNLTFYTYSLSFNQNGADYKNYISTARLNEDYFVQFVYRATPDNADFEKALEVLM